MANSSSLRIVRINPPRVIIVPVIAELGARIVATARCLYSPPPCYHSRRATVRVAWRVSLSLETRKVPREIRDDSSI